MRLALLAGCLLAASPVLAADSAMPIARYAYLLPGSHFAQRHPLRVTITRMRFPQEVATVGDALVYLLARSGYRFDEARSPWAQTILLPQPLPEVHRDLGPIHLAEALSVLAGSAWRLKANPLYRTLIIEPTEAWQAQLKRTQAALEIEAAPEAAAAPYLEPAPEALELPLPTSLHDPAEIFVEDMTLEQALDLLVPVGWRLRPEVEPALLQARISLISSTTWWDALHELARQLGAQTRNDLLLHVFEDQRLVVLEQS